jgi:hypothetical protein
MTQKVKVSELPEFDAAEYLNSEEDTAAYLTTVLEENDPALLAAALGDVKNHRQKLHGGKCKFTELTTECACLSLPTYLPMHQ